MGWFGSDNYFHGLGWVGAKQNIGLGFKEVTHVQLMGCSIISRLKLFMINTRTKFEVPSFIHCKDMRGDQNLEKIGDVTLTRHFGGIMSRWIPHPNLKRIGSPLPKIHKPEPLGRSRNGNAEHAPFGGSLSSVGYDLLWSSNQHVYNIAAILSNCNLFSHEDIAYKQYLNPVVYC